MKNKKAVKVLCVKTVTMLDSEDEIAFLEGKEYIAYYNKEGELFCKKTECKHTSKHIIRDYKDDDLEEFFHEYFKLVEA